MKRALIIFTLVAAPAAVQRQVDQVCRGYCSILAIQRGAVRFTEQGPRAPRNLILGRYLLTAQSLVPSTEAPIRDFRSRDGWRIVASAFLRHDAENEGVPGLRLRFFDPKGVARLTDDVLMSLIHADIGRLFGGPDEIFAVTSNEEHAYNTQTEIWFLPASGPPKLLLTIAGGIQAFSKGSAEALPGVRIARQIYDGVHAESKGTIREFYTWDRATKSLIR